MSDKKNQEKPITPLIKPTTGKLYENSKEIPKQRSKPSDKKDK